jgi:hypothetical protein
MWLSTIPLFLCFVASFWLIDIKSTKTNQGNIYSHLKEAIGNFARNEKLRLLSLSDMLGFALGESAFQFTPVFVAGLWPLWAIGAARMLANMEAIGFGFEWKDTKGLKEKRLMFEQIYSKTLDLWALFSSVISPIVFSHFDHLWSEHSSSKLADAREFSDKQRATRSINSLEKYSIWNCLGGNGLLGRHDKSKNCSYLGANSRFCDDLVDMEII